MKGCAAALIVALGGVAGGCATTKQDVSGTGDERIDESNAPEKAGGKDAGSTSVTCGPPGKGDLVLLDAREATPVSCALVTISKQPLDCSGGECAAGQQLRQGWPQRSLARGSRTRTTTGELR